MIGRREMKIKMKEIKNKIEKLKNEDFFSFLREIYFQGAEDFGPPTPNNPLEFLEMLEKMPCSPQDFLEILEKILKKC
jgi:hypothetical protein